MSGSLGRRRRANSSTQRESYFFFGKGPPLESLRSEQPEKVLGRARMKEIIKIGREVNFSSGQIFWERSHKAPHVRAHTSGRRSYER